jgi:hypothetical protein
MGKYRVGQKTPVGRREASFASLHSKTKPNKGFLLLLEV